MSIASDRAIDAAAGSGTPSAATSPAARLGGQKVAAVSTDDLDRTFAASAPNANGSTNFAYYVDREKVALWGCRHRSVLTACDRSW